MQIIKYLTNTCLSVQIMHAMNYDHISSQTEYRRDVGHLILYYPFYSNLATSSERIAGMVPLEKPGVKCYAHGPSGNSLWFTSCGKPATFQIPALSRCRPIFPSKTS